MNTRVVKLGGSLLELADLPVRLERWLLQQSPATTLIVVGGGETVELIRRKQHQWRFDDELAHQAALRAMDLNADLVAAGLAFASLLKDWFPAKQVPVGETVVVACAAWATGERAFERSWRTTSDSIAAEVAARTRAGELVMLKSSLPETASDRANYLDPLFGRHLPAGIRLRLVDLAQWDFPEVAESG